MPLAVEAWSPEYSAALDLSEPEEVSVEAVRTDWEPWEPKPQRPRPPDVETVAFVDGARRLDARVFFWDGDAPPAIGVAASVGIGAVVCNAAGGPAVPGGARAALFGEAVKRYLAVSGGRSPGLSAAPGLLYEPMAVAGESLDVVVDALQDQMRRLEADLAVAVAGDGRIVFADGPLAKIDTDGRDVVGYIKSHNRRYLQPDEERVLARLGCGERSPVFSFGERRPRFSWYVRLCERGRNSHGWHGLVRCEVPFSIGVDRAVAVADASTALLPRFASKPHWDKRAPQNLVPIAGLERRLRSRMSDATVVHRTITLAAARGSGEGEAVA
jgi:hypothetical protein